MRGSLSRVQVIHRRNLRNINRAYSIWRSKFVAKIEVRYVPLNECSRYSSEIRNSYSQSLLNAVIISLQVARCHSIEDANSNIT